MILNTIIEKISIKDKDKEGKPYVDKNGKKFIRVGIKVPEYKEKGLSKICYEMYDTDKEILGGEENQNIMITVEPNGEGLNFKKATKTDMLEARIDNLENLINEYLSKDKGEFDDIQDEVPDEEF